MEYLRETFREHKRLIIAVVVLFVIGVLYAFLGGNGEPDFETEIMKRTTVRQVVEETGAIESIREADLSLEQTGKVASVLVEKGDIVSDGDSLILLDQSEQQANLLSAEANLRVEEATLADMKTNAEGATQLSSELSTIKELQEQLVENAYAKLLSDGLVAEPDNDTFTQTPPVISGRYSGPPGAYRAALHRGSQWTDYEVSVFGLETIRSIDVSDTAITPLGTRGLFISFSDPVVGYMDTRWTVALPNTKSSLYVQNYNAYVAAKESAEAAITETEVNTEKIKSQEARVEQARAAVTVAQVQLSKRTLRAPFSGIVTDVHVTEGEVVSASTPIVSLISDNDYEIVVDIPESDIAHVSVGDLAVITFDAYEDETFTAMVSFITPSAKVVDGVSSLETTLQFDEVDERIRAGLSADVEILAEQRFDVFAVPGRAIILEEGGKFVRVVENGVFIKVPVETGLRGSDGLVEIVSGLSEGDEVVTFISQAVLEAYEASR